ncbi:MAG TPA: Asd/ArgC dimerization domain-containing protein [Gaiellaceae bacterium]|nr:Asd/ArgC dimerization domain-containing protein [Gaiellaceae bacterium]
MRTDAKIGVIGATGAVGAVTMRLLAARGHEHVRAFASGRSAGRTLDGGIVVEEASPEALAAAGLDLALFSVGTSASRELVPHAVDGGALVVDKSSAYRLVDGYPLVVPEVNGARALEAIETTRVVANPNCCTIPLTCVLKPLHDAAGLRRVRVSTYQSVSGAGAQRMEQLRNEPPEEHNLVMDWSWEGDETDEESKLRAETRKILELPDLPLSATTVRVPVLVGHAESVWIETEEPLTPEQASQLLAAAPSVRVVEVPAVPTPRDAAQTDDVLVGRIRPDRAAERNGLALFLACDNLNKGAALNAIQIAELMLSAREPTVPEQVRHA